MGVRLQIDIAAGGENLAVGNSDIDPSIEMTCIDDLIFNPLQTAVEAADRYMQPLLREQARLAEVFTDYLVNFVHRGSV